MSNICSKTTSNGWKDKAIFRQKELNKLKKRNKELVISRNKWKEKYKSISHKQAKVISVDISKTLSDGDSPEGYTYTSTMISLCIMMLSYTGCSLRASRHFIVQLYLVLGLEEQRCPSHTTIRMWACKIGYYQGFSDDPKEGDWLLIIDESVSLGENKALLVLCIQLDLWSFEHAATGKDISLLHFAISPKWESKEISLIIERLQQSYSIKYVTSDRGNNLMKSYKMAGLLHIPDCTHALAKALERYCKKCEEASHLLSRCGELRKKWNMGKKTVFMPPSQRNKARFHNLKPIADWATDILRVIDSFPQEIQDELSFLQDYNKWIEEFVWINNFIAATNKQLKINGYNNQVNDEIHEELSRLHESLPWMSSFAQTFLVDIENYLLELKQKATKGETLFCCSDIIESTFGRIKYKTSPNSPFGMTEFSFALASLGRCYKKEQVVMAMENVTEKDIKDWKAANVPDSLFSKRKKIFGEKMGEVFSKN